MNNPRFGIVDKNGIPAVWYDPTSLAESEIETLATLAAAQSTNFVSPQEYHSHSPWCKARRMNSLIPELCNCPERNNTKHMASNESVQQQFTTGATRSGNVDKKFDYEGFVSPVVEQIFAEYMHKHRVQRDGKIRASDNWQEGIPIASYVKSFVRHSMEFRAMWRGRIEHNVDSGEDFTLRDVICAMRFNLDGLLLELERAGMLNDTFVSPSERKALEAKAGIA